MSYKPRLRYPKLPLKLPYLPTCVIFGKTGAGKTSLCNKMCGTSHPAEQGIGSVTQVLYRNIANCGEYCFSIIDTPGTDSELNTYEHAILLKAALTAVPLNTIFILVKFDNRYNKIRQEFLELLKIVEEYKANVVLLISHWDTCKDPEKTLQSLQETFAKEPNTNFLCYSEQSPSDPLASFLYSCMSNMQPRTLFIDEVCFLSKFEICSLKLQMNENYERFMKQIDEVDNIYFKAAIDANEITDVEEKDEVLHYLIIECKREFLNILEVFEKKYSLAMEKMEYYTFYIEMRKEILKRSESFARKISKWMSYSLFDKEDPRNLIKRCPFCEEIWFKTEGCNGQTSCGQRGFSNYYDISKKVSYWVKFIALKIGGKLIITKSKQEKKVNKTKSSSDGEKENQKMMKEKNMLDKIRPRGCGKSFVWGELPNLEKDLICQIFSVASLDQVRELIKNNNLEKERKAFEKRIDFKFKN